MAIPTLVLEQLRSLGSEQYRKTYRRHGVAGDLFGVSYTDLKTLAKRIKNDHDLARELWASGNHDARVLATMVADPTRADSEMLDSWASDLGNYVVSDAFSGYAAKTPFAREKMEQWTLSEWEWIGAVGWNVLGQLALEDASLPDSYFEPFLERIERQIHSSANRVRYSMNNALIAIGMRDEFLRDKAVAAAERIGKVKVDHGETSCKTPDAIAYIQKAAARKKGG